MCRQMAASRPIGWTRHWGQELPQKLIVGYAGRWLGAGSPCQKRELQDIHSAGIGVSIRSFFGFER